MPGAEFGIKNRTFPVAWNEIEFLDVRRCVPLFLHDTPGAGMRTPCVLPIRGPKAFHVLVQMEGAGHHALCGGG